MFDYRKTVLALVILAFSGQGPVYGNEHGGDGTSEAVAEKAATASGDDGKPPPTEDKAKKKKSKDPNRGRFLPIPIFITEPAVGEGFGLALAYFHRKKELPQERKLASPYSIAHASDEQAPPPTVTGILGAVTNNGTKAAGVGHMNSFRNDQIRFTGALGLADVNSTFYLLDYPFKFNLRGKLVFQETRFRMGDSKLFLGIGLSYLDASSAFRVEIPEEPPLDSLDTFDLFRSDVTNSGLSAKLAWDSRDNTSMPNKGQLFDLALWRYDEFLGGDSDYWDVRLKMLSFHQLTENFVLGGRLEFSAIDGNAPFFAIPWVTLRGIPAMRYQGDRVGVFELEGRYNFSPKWAMIAFAGSGSVSSNLPAIDTEQSIYNYGLGGRFKIFEAQNVWVGIDIAQGPEDTNWYIQVGHAW
jgi:hypothetical protein